MSLYARLKANNGENVQNVTRACETLRRLDPFPSNMSDNLVISSPTRASDVLDTSESAVIAWINSHSRHFPKDQTVCAACGREIDSHAPGWVILGDKALICYGGVYGLSCWRKWRDMRRRAAVAEMAPEPKHVSKQPY